MTIISKDGSICGSLRKELAHSPDISQVLTIENVIKNSAANVNSIDICKKLSGKIPNQSVNMILRYLETSGKIIRDRKGKLVWIYNTEAVKSFRISQKKRLVLK